MARNPTPEASRPCLFADLLKLDGDSILCSTWRAQSTATARHEIDQQEKFISFFKVGLLSRVRLRLSRRKYIEPVARANSIYKNICWHTFRHTFDTLLKANGEDVKTIQELLRRANSRITLEGHTQAVTSNKRTAQCKL